MGKPRLTRGLGARVLCTAPRRGFPIVLFALSGPELAPFRTFLTRALRKKAASVSGIMRNRVPTRRHWRSPSPWNKRLADRNVHRPGRRLCTARFRPPSSREAQIQKPEPVMSARNYLFTDKDDDRDPTGGSATWTCGQSVRESSSKARRAQRATALSFLRRALRTQPCFTPAGFINNRPRGEATAMLHKGNDDYLPL